MGASSGWTWKLPSTRRWRPDTEEAIDAAPRQVARERTLLVVVGRGASDPDANSNVAKVMRLLWEEWVSAGPRSPIRASPSPGRASA